MTSELPQGQSIKLICKKEDNAKLLVDFIAENSSLSKSLIKKLMVFGSVLQTFQTTKRRTRKAKTTVRAGDMVECYYDPRIDLDASFEFNLIYETTQYGIYHKPVGALTEGTKYGDGTSLFRYVEKLKRYAFPVNRLDKDTEGLVVVAYNSKSQNHLQGMWKNDVTKAYQAIVCGKLEGSGEFDFPINEKPAQTPYECIRTEANQTLIEVYPTTEKKSQIRVHFSKAGHPIVGDFKYNKSNRNKGGLKLICHQLEFTDPHSNKKISVSLPEDRFLF